MTQSTWTCQRCKEPIGTVTNSNDLIVTATGCLIERTRAGTIVHCRCGKAMLWPGRRVVLNASVLQVDRSIG